MQLARSLLFDALFYLTMAVMGIAFAPLALVSRAGAYWVLHAFVRVTLPMLRLICGVRVEVRGMPPRGAALIVAKHQSFLDILIIWGALERPKFIMKREILWTPFIGLYAWRTGSAPVNRGKKGRAVEAMVANVTREQAEPSQTVIYPQGTRVATDVPVEKAPYKIGAGVLYERLGLPTVPVATNAGLFWGRKSIVKRPGLAVVEFLDPLPPGLKRDAFMAAMRERIETASERLMAEARG